MKLHEKLKQRIEDQVLINAITTQQENYDKDVRFIFFLACVFGLSALLAFGYSIVKLINYGVMIWFGLN